MKIFFKNLGEYLGKKVSAKGFVKNLRKTKSICFLILTDSTGDLQVVVDSKNKFPEFNPHVGSCVCVEGTLVKNDSVKLNGMELIPDKIEILSSAELYPIDSNSEPSLKQDFRFLVLREERNRAIFQIQTEAERLMREYWASKEFIEIHSPKILGAPSESGAELFELNYFGQKAYLAQSPQFYKQMAIAAGFDKIFEIGPVFRAENSNTTRHAAEFTSIDVEFAWIDSHFEIMQFEEDWLRFVLNGVSKNCSYLMKKNFGIEYSVPEGPFPRMSFAEAVEVLKSLGHIIPEGEDLDSEREKLLYSYVKEKYNHEFLFVYDYPVSVRPFYHMYHEENQKLTKSYDLLWKGVEITTGAQREHRYEILKKQSEEKGLKLVDFYLTFFKYGCPPHGGFGFGLTRMLMILLGLNSIREATFLFRGPNRLLP